MTSNEDSGVVAWLLESSGSLTLSSGREITCQPDGEYL